MAHAFRSAALIEAEAAQKKLDRLRERWASTKGTWFDGTVESVDRRIAWLGEVETTAKGAASRLYASKAGADAMALLPQIRADRNNIVGMRNRLAGGEWIPEGADPHAHNLDPREFSSREEWMDAQNRSRFGEFGDDYGHAEDHAVPPMHEDMRGGQSPWVHASLREATSPYMPSPNAPQPEMHEDGRPLTTFPVHDPSRKTHPWTGLPLDISHGEWSRLPQPYADKYDYDVNSKYRDTDPIGGWKHRFDEAERPGVNPNYNLSHGANPLTASAHYATEPGKPVTDFDPGVAQVSGQIRATNPGASGISMDVGDLIGANVSKAVTGSLREAAQDFVDGQNTTDRTELRIRAQRLMSDRTSSWEPTAAAAAVRAFTAAVDAAAPRQMRTASAPAEVVEDFDDHLMFS